MDSASPRLSPQQNKVVAIPADIVMVVPKTARNGKGLHWLQIESTEKQRLIRYFTALGAREAERFALNEVMAERDRQIASSN